ncbi:YxD-tail cyclophane-containing RiPP peptide [Streptomyces sp. NRRL S-646]|uniref:YxD-tail cyclophane-containing RiPP peptide n=1 Tax=Streptomyces sp. NRRL S-646 TaxID=1463917 RepID=UPI0004C63C46|nr:YxD-tail cyclophane-containing RiPP peptide [Streptomyces sp. NRRL S-646]
MSNPRLDGHLVADGPDQAVRFSPASGGGLELLRRGLGHPVLTEVLRHLLERERQAAGRPIAYYEDSP